jgi:transposase
MPGPGLLSEIICDKFIYHLPFYRQVQRYEPMEHSRSIGMKIPASTLDGWFEAASALLEPLYESLKAQVLSSSYVQADETVCLEAA